MLIKTINAIKKGYKLKQNPNIRTLAKITKQLRINWKNESEYIQIDKGYELCGAYAYIDNKRIKFYETSSTDNTDSSSLEPEDFQ